MITITESAQDYLAELLLKQDGALGVRVFINQPGTARAETCIAYCREDDLEESDEVVELTIKAPNAKLPRVNDDSSLEDRVNYVLYNEVNPALASHGGEVSLVEITDTMVAILQFGGGCQGCSAVDQTLKGGVEKTLLEQIPQLTGVRDTTDHSDTSQAYY
jgi:Fe/S biogenesis protein NfuA